MEEVKKNHQIVYYDPRNAMGLSINLLMFGYKQFVTTTKYKNLDALKKLSDGLSPHTPEGFNHFTDFAMEHLIDSIKISICFENFIKAMLLLNGFVIHKLDKNIFPDLSKEQYKRPVHLREILSISEWQANPKIDKSVPGFQINGITKLTIGMKELTSPGYLTPLNIGDKIMGICSPYFQYRNNLHYYVMEEFTFKKSDYADFLTIIKFINLNHVSIQHTVIDELKMGQNYKLKAIEFPPDNPS